MGCRANQRGTPFFRLCAKIGAYTGRGGMDMTWTTEYEMRKATAGEVELRAEAVTLQLCEEGRGAARVNHFYRRLTEAWFARCIDTLPSELPPGRYLASLVCQAEECDGVLTVRLGRCLCRRGRQIAALTDEHRWTLPRGWMLAAHRRRRANSPPTKEKKFLPKM